MKKETITFKSSSDQYHHLFVYGQSTLPQVRNHQEKCPALSFTVYFGDINIQSKYNLHLISWFYFSIRNLHVKEPNASLPLPSHLIPSLSAYLEQFLPKLRLSFHSISTNEVVQGKTNQTNQKLGKLDGALSNLI